ncbi:O-antigen ligase family protein [Candidatus Falkowbacteria bacterium]|nr:O-antigen ligase family protein [Candidatus Falkowbacteria bacterium]
MLLKLKLSKILEWGIYLLVFLLPWQTRWMYQLASLNSGYWEYGSNSLYGTQILLYLLVVLFFIYLKKNKIRPQKTVLDWLLVGLVVWSLLASAWALDWNIAIYHWVILVSGFLLYFLLRHGPVNRMKVMISLVAAGAVQGGLALYQFLSQGIVGSKWLGLASQSAQDLGVLVVEYGDQRWLRAYGSLPHPNMLAAFLLVGLICALGLSFLAHNRWQRLLVTGSWLLMLGGLLFTFSRVAWLVLGMSYVVCGMWLLVKRVRSIFTWQLLMAGAVLVVLLSAIFWQPISSRVLSQGRLDSQSYQSHVDLTAQSFTVLKSHWLSGVGLGNYTVAAYRELDSSRPVWAYQPVHNVFLLVWAELGIVGLALYVLGMGYVVCGRRGGLVGKVALIALLLLGLFDHFLWSLYFGVMLWWVVMSLAVPQE